MRDILTPEEVADAQTMLAKWVRFINPKQRPKQKIDGFKSLGTYNGRKDHQAYIKTETIIRIKDIRIKEQEQKDTIDFYLNKIDDKKIEILANITGVRCGDHFIIQYSRKKSDATLITFDRNLIVTELTYLASLYCAAEKYLKNNKVNQIIFPPAKLYGILLDEEGIEKPKYRHKLDLCEKIRKDQQQTASLQNQYMILGFGSKETNFKRKYNYMRAGVNTNGKLLEDHLKSLR